MALERKDPVITRLVKSGEVSALMPTGRTRFLRDVISDNNREAEFQFNVSSFRNLLRDNIDDRRRTLSAHRMFARPGIPGVTQIVKFSGL